MKSGSENRKSICDEYNNRLYIFLSMPLRLRRYSKNPKIQDSDSDYLLSQLVKKLVKIILNQQSHICVPIRFVPDLQCFSASPQA